MIAFACHTWSFPDLTLAETFGVAARLGFRHVDLGSGAVLNAARAAADPRQLAADLRADLTLFDLTVSDLYLMLPRISLAATLEDAERRAREIDLFRALVPFAVELGAAGITVSPGLAPPPDAITPPEDALDEAPDGLPADPPIPPGEFAFNRATDALRTMLETARSAGIALSIEPHLDSVAPTPAEARRLLAAVPGLSITLDLAELTCQNIPFDDAAALLPHVRHVQVRGAARNRLQTPHDKSTVDVPRWMAALRSAGYDGRIAVELIPPGNARHGSQKVASILREAAALRDVWKTARDAG